MKYKFLFALAAVFPLASGMLFSKNAIKAAANSAPPYWEGTSSSGAIVKGENCPVVVEKEVLNLNISSLPRGGQIELEKYDAEAIAEYSFYNPTDLNVDMTLLFPFGAFPSYVPEGANDEVSAVTVDGESTACRVRYSYAPYDFNIDRDMARVQDEKKKDPFYTEDTPVMHYQITVNVPEGRDVYPLLKTKLSFNPKKTRVLFPSESDTRLSISDGDMYACAYMREAGDKTFEFYAAGDVPITVDPKLYNGDNEIAAVSSLTSADTTFSEFVLSKRSENLEVGDTDWYNAFVDMLNDRSGKDGSVDGYCLEEKDLMRWYEYEMSIPAGGRRVNRVRAPLYPTVEGNRNPRYEYSYLLSPAGKWADFKEIEIKIDTPYYLSNGSLDFTKTDKEGGKGFTYSYHRSSLPQGELTFVLTEKDEADSDFNLFGKKFLHPALTWAFVTLLALAGVAAVVTVIVVVSLRNKKKKK
ncbi:MAG: hypothetical protein K2L02_00425 [Clostridia bacterium]|nr:hypothetical protein [Clostridia bacterium]